MVLVPLSVKPNRRCDVVQTFMNRAGLWKAKCAAPQQGLLPGPRHMQHVRSDKGCVRTPVNRGLREVVRAKPEDSTMA